MKVTRWVGLAVAAMMVLGAAEGYGAGLLVPKEEHLPPLAIKYLRVDTTIDNQAATTRVVQEFQNSTSRDLECTYIFPLPKGAALRDFAMYIGGKRMKGELLEKEKARQVYEEIVRRARDPGLLEYMDGSILRLRIFPVPANGTQKVELEYTELVPVDDGLAEYVFPLRVGEKASRTLEDFTVSVRIRSGTAIKSVYSPTHEVGIARPSDHEAVAGMETKGTLLDRDFHLFYTLSEKDFGLSLMTYRPDPEKPGMFLILLSPKSEINADQRPPRDVAFVLDTSGSMKEGGKLEQAKKALKFCIEKLDKRDRFAVIQFSTMAQPFADAWTEATDDSRAKAAAWIEKFEASGGTNIAEALTKVLGLPTDPKRPVTVMFLTDGRPTVDTTDTEALVKLVKDKNAGKTRLFTFGVGDDVNTHLLDRIANDSGGLPEYVRPAEAIDGKVTRLFSKMSHPVLTNLALEMPGVKVTEMYPKELPDLFRGGQLVLLGAYEGSGDSAIRLTGRLADKTEKLTYEGTFPQKTTDKPFIGPLYANRKIGFLLDQIRLHGENRELKDEVVRLSLAYGIETPYTSYLVLENEAQYKQYGITVSGAQPRPEGYLRYPASPGERESGGSGRRGGEGVITGPAPATATPAPDAAQIDRVAERLNSEFKPAAKSAEPADAYRGDTRSHGYTAGAATATGAPQSQTAAQPARGSDEVAGLRADEKDLRDADTGKTAVDIAQQIQRLRQSEQVARTARKVQQASNRQFVNYRNVWVDQQFQGTERLLKIKWGSEAYFRLAREKEGLRQALSQGQRLVIVTARGQAVAVDPDEGIETLTDDEFKALFTDAPEAK
jgi:Ca-activated chloride channel family protein